MAGSPDCVNRRQVLAATGSVLFLSGCIDTGSDAPPPTTLDEFDVVDSSRAPVEPTVTGVETEQASTTVTIEGRVIVGTPCTELVVEQNPHLSADGEAVFLEIGGHETDESCEAEIKRVGFRLVFTVRDIRPETVHVMEDAVSTLSHSLEIPYPENQTETTTT